MVKLKKPRVVLPWRRREMERRLREAEEALQAERLKNNVLIEALTGRKAP